MTDIDAYRQTKRQRTRIKTEVGTRGVFAKFD